MNDAARMLARRGARSSMNLIDLRSDTVTLPSEGMRQAMARAVVGDDQYGEDPTVNKLQERIANDLGKEDALFVASGTMANQIALRVLAKPGDEVLVGYGAHMLLHESGASAVSGVQLSPLGSSGIFGAEHVRAAFKPAGHPLCAPTTMVVIENTHNLGGGIVFPYAESLAVCKAAGELGMSSYLDGARLFNAAIASGHCVKELSKPFRLVSIALSKGLGCPTGSVIAGSTADIAAAHRIRRILGGAMRQVGVLAAAGIYALDHNVGRLVCDHQNAHLLAQRLADVPGVELELGTVETNIVIFRTRENAPDAMTVVQRARRAGVLVSSFDHRTIRAVTCLNVGAAECEQAGRVLRDAISPC